MTHSITNIKWILNQLEKYKQENEILKQQNRFKNQLLDEKSNHIISCTSENIELRKQIQLLKNELKSFQNKKPNHSKTKNQNSANQTQQIKLILQDKQLSLDSNVSHLSFQMLDTDNTCTNEHKSMENTPTQTINRTHYIILPRVPTISGSTSTSNLSARACKLSLPNTSKSNNDDITPTPSIQPSMNMNKTNTILKTIAENNEIIPNSNHSYTFSPVTPITPKLNESNDNYNIHADEWNESVATIQPESSNNMSSMQVNVANIGHISEAVYIDDDEESVISLSELNDDDDESSMSGNTNLVFLNYNATVTDSQKPHIHIQHIEPKKVEIFEGKTITLNDTYSNISFNNELNNEMTIIKPMTVNTDTGNSTYDFPKAISMLSELTLSDVESYSD